MVVVVVSMLFRLGSARRSIIVVNGQRMVETGHVVDDVHQLTYRPGHATTGPIELLTFAEFRRVDRARRTRPQRPDFDVLALVRAGTGRLRVDFDDTALAPRSVAWIRPG